MKAILLLLSLTLIHARNYGSINVEGVGNIYVVGGDGPNVEMINNGFKLNGGGGIHFAKEASDSFYPGMYWVVSNNSLLG